MLVQDIEKVLLEHLPGYSLVSVPDRVNTATKIHVRCEHGHDWSTARLGNIKNGIKCPLCPKVRHNRLTLEEVKQRITNAGWELLGDTYTSAFDKLHIRCNNCGFERNAQLTNIHSRCQQCRRQKYSGDCLDRLRSTIENRNHILLNEDLTESRLHSTNLHVRCQNGHTYENSYKNIVTKGQGCGHCINNRMLDLAGIRARLDPGYEVQGEYVNNRTPLSFICDLGHHYTSTWGTYHKGHRCPECHGAQKLTNSEVNDKIEKFGYTWAGGVYTNVNSILVLNCPNENHGTFQVKFTSLYTEGNKCPGCKASMRSAGEMELFEWVAQHTVAEASVRSLLVSGKEVDIFCPDKKIAIEYNGLFYHNESTKTSGYHAEKYLELKLSGINLITIFEDEWLNNKNVVKSVILSKLGICSRKVYARSTDIRKAPKKEFRLFFGLHHLQGAPDTNTDNGWGLYLEDELLMAASISNGHRQNLDKNCLFIDRVCVKGGVSVPGGFTKLLAPLKSFALANSKDTIRTYSDRRYSSGKLYEAGGFEKVRELPPDYSYVKGGERKSKQSMRLKDFEKGLGKTEAALRKEQGWLRIWDCGKDVWELKLV